MLIMKGYDVATLPLEKTAGKLKYVSPDDQIVLQAKHLGISFGDQGARARLKNTFCKRVKEKRYLQCYKKSL